MEYGDRSIVKSSVCYACGIGEELKADFFDKQRSLKEMKQQLIEKFVIGTNDSIGLT